MKAQNWITREGMHVSFIEAKHLPMVDIQIAFDAGSIHDGAQQGLAYLTNSLLTKGTKKWATDEIVERLEGVGAQLGASAYSEFALIHLRSLSESEYLTQALSILESMLSEPAFLAADFEQEKAQLLVELEDQAQQPDEVARKAFYEALYTNHPYANWLYGNFASVKKITNQDVITFYKKYYIANNAVLSIVGDISIEDAKKIAEKLSKILNIGIIPERVQPVPECKAIQKHIDFPSDQTHIMMGLSILKQNDPDFFPLIVGNHILGANGTVNRLFQEIREKRGFAYEVGSYFLPLREAGPFIINMQTQKVDEALALTKSLVHNFIEKGPTAEELEAAKSNLLGAYILKFDTNKSILDYLTIMRFYQLPHDFFDTYQQHIKNVSLASVRDVFKRRFNLDNMRVISVGRR